MRSSRRLCGRVSSLRQIEEVEVIDEVQNEELVNMKVPPSEVLEVRNVSIIDFVIVIWPFDLTAIV